MQNPLRNLLIDDDGNLEWELFATHAGCPSHDSIEYPTVAALCLTRQTDEQDYRSQILNIVFMTGTDTEEPTYEQVTWDWYNNPDPNLMNLRILGNPLEDINPAIKKTVIDQLTSMVNALRTQYNLPVFAGETPRAWVSGKALEGGTLIRVGFRYYWVRIDLTAAENTRSPATEEAAGSLVRFRLFNQGIPTLPNHNITIDREIVVRQTDMREGRIFRYDGEIVPEVNLKFFDFVPPADVPIENLQQGDRFSVSNSVYRLIARVIQVSDFLVVIDSSVKPPRVLSGTRLVFDPEWDAGDWIEEQTVRMRFLVSKRK